MVKERAPALTEGLRIIEKAIASKEAITFESILSEVNMSRSSINRLLKVLVDSGYLVACEGRLGGYIPGIRLFSMLQHLNQNSTSQFEYLKNQIKLLSQKTGTAIQYAFFDRTINRIYVLYKAECNDSLKVGGYGDDTSNWVHRHVIGKLILAYCEDEEKNIILANCKAEKIMKNTILPGKKFERLLEYIRKCGYAEDHEEHAYYIFRTGLPVFSQDGKITGVVCSAWYAPEFDENFAADIRKGLQTIVDFLKIDMKITK